MYLFTKFTHFRARGLPGNQTHKLDVASASELQTEREREREQKYG